MQQKGVLWLRSCETGMMYSGIIHFQSQRFNIIVYRNLKVSRYKYRIVSFAGKEQVEIGRANPCSQDSDFPIVGYIDNGLAGRMDIFISLNKQKIRKDSKFPDYLIFELDHEEKIN